MKLKMTINKIKSIDSLTIEMPVDKGLYALTGQNGAGIVVLFVILHPTITII